MRFPHYFLKEISEAPASVEKTLVNRWRVHPDTSLPAVVLSDNVILVGGVSTLIPGKGFDDLFGVTDPFSAANAQPGKADTLRAMFVNLVLTY